MLGGAATTIIFAGCSPSILSSSDGSPVLMPLIPGFNAALVASSNTLRINSTPSMTGRSLPKASADYARQDSISLAQQFVDVAPAVGCDEIRDAGRRRNQVA